MPDFEYEFSPEESHYYHQRLVDEQFNVFGEERVKQSFGHEATEADTERFKNTVETLCEEMGSQEAGDTSYLSRTIHRKDGPALVLWGNPEDRHGFGNMGEIDRSPAAVRNVDTGRLTLFRPRNGLSPGRYTTLEHIFVDRLTGEVKIKREVIPRTPGGAYKSAIKNASKTEVDKALDTIAQAVAQEESSD